MYVKFKMNQDNVSPTSATKCDIKWKRWKEEDKMFLKVHFHLWTSPQSLELLDTQQSPVMRELEKWRLVLNCHWFKYPWTSFVESFSWHYWKRREQYPKQVFWLIMLNKDQTWWWFWKTEWDFSFFSLLFFLSIDLIHSAQYLLLKWYVHRCTLVYFEP